MTEKLTPDTLLCDNELPHDWHSGQSGSVDCTECDLNLTRSRFKARHDLLERALSTNRAELARLQKLVEKQWVVVEQAKAVGAYFRYGPLIDALAALEQEEK